MAYTLDGEFRSNRGIPQKTPSMIDRDEEIDQSTWTNAAKKFYKELQELEKDRIPPKNGIEYSIRKKLYNIDDDTSLKLHEMQENLARLTANRPELKTWQIYVLAGYKWKSYIRECGEAKRTKAHLTANYNNKFTPEVQAFCSHLKYGAAQELLIDATWVLNESVNLYELSKREGQLSVAARLLDQISTHVDVNSKVNQTNVVVTDTLDFAALLGEADSRIQEPSLVEDSPLQLEDTEQRSDLITEVRQQGNLPDYSEEEEAVVESTHSS